MLNRSDLGTAQRTSSLKREFNRQVYSLLGILVDDLTINETIELLQTSASLDRRCVFCTPNMNFLRLAEGNDRFRTTLNQCDLGLLDSFVLKLLTKCLGIPISETVPGSTLFERLSERNSKPDYVLKVFFFGGDNNAAELAMNRVNRNAGGLKCVGALNPGFGSFEDLSTPEIVRTINQSDADFIIVSLGAEKGHAWIAKNAPHLKASLISHLGAVIYFSAGTLLRAPKFFQSSGLEWLWRIKEQPSLWRRYFLDALSLLRLMVFQIAPIALANIRYSDNHRSLIIKKEMCPSSNSFSVIFKGPINVKNIQQVRELFFEMALNPSALSSIDMSGVTHIDAAGIAQFILLKKHLHDRVTVSFAKPHIRKKFELDRCVSVLSR